MIASGTALQGDKAQMTKGRRKGGERREGKLNFKPISVWESHHVIAATILFNGGMAAGTL